MQFADPTNDLAFRKIFGNENKKQRELYELAALKAFDDTHAIDTAREEGRLQEKNTHSA